MNENYYILLNQIGEFLEAPTTNSSITKYIDKIFMDMEEKEKAIQIIFDFVKLFSQFRDINPLRKIVYQIILETLSNIQKIEELNDLLLINCLLRFLEIYLINSNFPEKKIILSTLAKSLAGLAPAPLILNLCTIIKPKLLSNSFEYNYAQKKNNIQMNNSEIAIEIKSKIENWIKSLALKSQDLNNNLDIQASLSQQVIKYAKEFDLDIQSEEFSQIMKECQEIMNITLIAISIASDSI